jgi:hypothetical protein
LATTVSTNIACGSQRNVVYEKVTLFEEDEEGLGRLILTDHEEIKDLVARIDHTKRKEILTENQS